MDLRQLRQFVAVAEERSFRRAAERLHVSQPPLSVAVQRLEADIGVQLLDRNRHGVKLTPAGEAFLLEARRTLAHANLAVEIAQRAASGKVGTLRLSFVPSAGIDVVPRLLRAFRKDHADVKLILRGETSAHQLAGLAQGSVDVGIVVPPLQESRELRVQAFSEEELVLAVPGMHPLAGLKRVQLKDLADEPFVGFPVKEGPGFENVVMAACQDCGFIPRSVQTASQMQAILALVAGGLGVALVPKAMSAVVMENVSYLQLRKGNATIRYPLALAWNPANPNPALNAFLAVTDRLRPRQLSPQYLSAS
ncbi:MAG: Transcriptional regulator, LysR family [Ramlibacter sp.]|jgi:DNA-binding transcriptional LysR family regulator|nr:Transcriptional regulator, LysR family [Ramlibacter sp.]MDB5911924.1 Transcriptional regulator, LysR family [Ramlibacter sp.]